MTFMKRKLVFLMACALMIAGIALIVNSVFDFIGKVGNEETTAVTEVADTEFSVGSTEIE